MDKDDLTAILLVILLSIALSVLTGGCALPGIDTGKGIFSAPRPPAVPQSDYKRP